MTKRPVIAVCIPAPDMMYSATCMSLAWLCIHSKSNFDIRPFQSKSSNIAIVRNNGVATAKMHCADYLLFIDSDMRFPRDTLDRLMAHDKDIVGANYPQRCEPFMMLGMASAGQDTTKQDGLIEMDHMPTGILLIKMSVFNKLSRPYFRCPFDENGHITGEDYDFSERVRDELDYKIYNDIDLAKEIRHIGIKEYSYDSEEVQNTMNTYMEKQKKFSTPPISISVLIPSRGRPDLLKMTVLALDHLASESNKITYCIAADIDDVATHVAAQELMKKSGNINIMRMDRPSGMGAMYNELAKAYPADAYCPLADDVIPLVQDWDEKVAMGMQQYPVLGWHDLHNGTFASYPIISKRWHDAAGNIFPEYFPFWWNDTWLNEVVTIVTGSRIPIATDMPLGGRRGKTHRLRDLAFWADFFRETRPERIQQADVIRDKLLLPPQPVGRMGLDFEKYDLFMQSNIQRFTELFGDNTPATPEYNEALKQAKLHIGRD